VRELVRPDRRHGSLVATREPDSGCCNVRPPEVT